MKKEFANIFDQEHIGVSIVSLVLLFVGIVSFISSLFVGNTTPIYTLITSTLLILFNFVFVALMITNHRVNKTMIYVAEGLLFIFYIVVILSTFGVIKLDHDRNYIDFRGMSVTEVMDWAIQHDVKVETIYEYSEMIPEYHVISQDRKIGSLIKDNNNLKISLSDGIDPNKEVIIPKMENWDDEKFVNFVEDNYLSNVEVEFVQSDILPNSVIEQSKTGTIRRSDELKVVFSYGNERNYDLVVLKDLTKHTKFEAEFYCKKYGLNYEFDKKFSKSIKKGQVMGQVQKAGDKINIHDDKVTIIISDGPEITVPNLRNMTTNEITAWIVKNKLRLSFTDMYDDTVEKNKVVKTNYSKGEKISQGTIVEIVLSKGQLKMKSFKDIDEFTAWAEQYHIPYSIKREYSDKVEVGKVISYSYKKGETIKNNDMIIVKVSDGKKKGVPDVVGMTKAKATSTLKDAGLNVAFVYSYDDGEAGIVLSQSITAGSDVTEGTTLTLNISTNNPDEED